jgi:hypothetical protein
MVRMTHPTQQLHEQLCFLRVMHHAFGTALLANCLCEAQEKYANIIK